MSGRPRIYQNEEALKKAKCLTARRAYMKKRGISEYTYNQKQERIHQQKIKKQLKTLFKEILNSDDVDEIAKLNEFLLSKIEK